MTSTQPRPPRSLGAAIALFFLAPLVAEFLLGNLPIQLLPALVMLAPMYGGGALVIREVVRRTGRGWPSISFLALGYGILEEAFTTQSLFNPNYLKLNLHLLDHAFIPALGIGAHWTVFVLTLHVAWSICTPIALVEAAFPGRATTPWLGRVGLSLALLLFALGIVGTTLLSYRGDRFKSSPAQFASAACAIVALIIVAFTLPRNRSHANGKAPGPWVPCALALAVGSAVLLIPSKWDWWAATAVVLLDLGMAATILIWSRRHGFTLLHKLALGAGAALAYGWHAFNEMPVIGSGSPTSVRIGNAIFGLAAIALIALAAKRASAFLRESADAATPASHLSAAEEAAQKVRT